MTEYIYKFYSERRNPRWYQPKKQTLYGTKTRIAALLRARGKSSEGYQNIYFENIKIERAEIGGWEDVTEQFT